MNKLKCTLLIDDDSTTNFINELLISEIGFTNRLMTAQSGQEALDLIQQNCGKESDCPDLIFLDINMPVMDGFEFLEAYEELNINREGTTIVMLTTSQNPKDKERIKNFKVADWLIKPLSEESIKALLQKHFDIEV